MKKKVIYYCFFSLIIFSLVSCNKIGYGVLLWSMEDPLVESGSVLPVYVKSNIEKKWVVGFPETEGFDKNFKFEIPFTQFHFAGNKKNAQFYAEVFAPHAKSYAENELDGLPIRDAPDNNARRVYRLRIGEIIKILGLAEGVPPIGTSGDPLPGGWYRVITNDGITGFCFSNRLRIFDWDANDLRNNPFGEENISETESANDLSFVLPARGSRLI